MNKQFTRVFELKYNGSYFIHGLYLYSIFTPRNSQRFRFKTISVKSCWLLVSWIRPAMTRISSYVWTRLAVAGRDDASSYSWTPRVVAGLVQLQLDSVHVSLYIYNTYYVCNLNVYSTCYQLILCNSAVMVK